MHAKGILSVAGRTANPVQTTGIFRILVFRDVHYTITEQCTAEGNAPEKYPECGAKKEMFLKRGVWGPGGR
jgi:hypothetical protein